MRRITHRKVSLIEVAMDCSLELVGVGVVDDVALINLRHPDVHTTARDRLHLVSNMHRIHRRLARPNPTSENPNKVQVLVVWPRQFVDGTAPERATVRPVAHPQRVL